jgi:hypothetical protein
MTFNGGGWTLLLATKNGQGPISATFGVVLPSDTVTKAMPRATALAMFQAARETHLRSTGLAATQSMTSYPLTQPMLNLRNNRALDSVFSQTSDSDWYGPYADPGHIDTTCQNTPGPFPDLYQACGTDGLHLLGPHSRWNWSGGATWLNVSMEFYIR